MNYFTKQWYELCQKTSMHLCLEEDKKAESFSEEYFQQLYKKKLEEYISLREEMGLYHEKYELGEKSTILLKPFDREKAAQQFYKGFIYNQEHVKKVLPEEILKKITDIRVYTLDRASNEVVKVVTKFCKDNEKLMEKTIEEYRKYYKKESKLFDRNIVENMNFHDCIVLDIKKTKQSLSMVFNNLGGFTNIYEMKFENYSIIKQDSLLENSYWIYDEIYKVDDKYEIHVLLQNKNMDLLEFIISAENVCFKRNGQSVI